MSDTLLARPIISPAIEWQGGAAINNRVQICQHSREIPTPLSIHLPRTAVYYRQLCLKKTLGMYTGPVWFNRKINDTSDLK